MISIYRRSPCAAAGAIAGGFAGLMIALLEIEYGTAPALTPASMFWGGVLLLTLVGLLIVLVLMGMMLRYGANAIVMPASVTCFLSVLVTVWLLETINFPVVGAPLGIAVGTVIGWILCLVFCGRESSIGVARG